MSEATEHQVFILMILVRRLIQKSRMKKDPIVLEALELQKAILPKHEFQKRITILMKKVELL